MFRLDVFNGIFYNLLVRIRYIILFIYKGIKIWFCYYVIKMGKEYEIYGI